MVETINISSTQNDLVKYCVKLQDSSFRKKEGLIFVDGEKTIQGLVDEGITFEYLFCNSEEAISKKAKIKKLVIATKPVLDKISTLKSPNNIAGIIKEPVIDKNLFLNMNRIALIENIKDPGNLGTIIRSAAAFSIEGIILFNECVDLYNTKTIRSTAQNIFKIPIVRTSDFEFIKKLKQNHKLISLVVNSKKNFVDYKFDDKYILALGSEASGLTKEMVELSDELLTFEMDNNVESLNLGICASVAFSLLKYRA